MVSPTEAQTNHFLTHEARAFYHMADVDNFSNHALQHGTSDLEDPEVIPDLLVEDEEDDDVVLEFIEECDSTHCINHTDGGDWIIPAHWELERTVYGLREDCNRFSEAEDAGSEVTYRCARCRNCALCRDGERLEAVSLREEAEQVLIEDSVEYLPEAGILQAKLPFIQPPEDHLRPNRHIAEKVFQSQLRQTVKDDQMRLDIIASHEKLRSRGHVCPLADLPEEDQLAIINHPEGTHHIPWRVVHKPTSLSTPTRMVFDASSKTPGGDSLNNILAKGTNTLANLNNKFMKFRCKPSGFTADIKMAYNAIKLHPSHYKYQLYLWKEELDPNSPTITMVIKTIIYGVRPSGNQLGAGFCKLANYVTDHYPDQAPGAKALKESSYVDDVMDPAININTARATAKSLEFTLGLADMKVKGFTFPGEPPSPDVSNDGKTVGLVGHTWEPKPDLIGPDIKPLFFGKVKRGKYPDLIVGEFNQSLKDNFTRRNLLGKVASVYDPTGLLTPVTSRFKLNLHTLCTSEKLD